MKQFFEMWITFSTVIFLTIMVTSCAGAASAYKAAEGIDQNAKVVAEHYYALVREANKMKKSGDLAGGDLVKAQQIVRDTRPAIVKLATAAQAYDGLQNATTEAELDQAIADAAIAISDLIDIIKAVRSSSQLEPPDPDRLPEHWRPPFKPKLIA